MKFSAVFALFSIASVATAEEGTIRKRELASAGGSIRFPTCFSEVAMVQVFGTGAVEMKDLLVGDRIFTGDNYQPVYAFAHKDTTAEAEFVQIQTDQGNTLEATGGHLVFVDGKSGPVRADSIQVGDVLQGAAVIDVGVVKRTGLYAPLTMDGKLIVNGVKASNYVSLEQADEQALFGYSVHGFSHFGIAPFRLLCNGVSARACESYTDEGVPTFLSFLYQTFDWFMGLPSIFQAVAIAVYLVVASAAWMLESIWSTTTSAPLLVGAGIVVAMKVTGVRIQASKVKTV